MIINITSLILSIIIYIKKREICTKNGESTQIQAENQLGKNM